MPRPYQVQDKYFALAKQKGYRARSAFKLIEIEEKFHLFRLGDNILDLGAAPGSFMQVMSAWVGPRGRVLGIDLQEMMPFRENNLKAVQGDIFDKAGVLAALSTQEMEKVDGVTSDLAPKTSGIKDVDTGLSAELTNQALHLATCVLRIGGFFVGKIFEGSDFQRVLKHTKSSFQRVHVFKPDACRDRSYETYIIGIGYRPRKA